MADQDEEEKDADSSAKNELLEAVDHFRRAANILFDRASKDPAVRTATEEAERVIKKLGDTAEPLARQLTSELAKLTKRITDTVTETAHPSSKKSEPPPAGSDD